MDPESGTFDEADVTLLLGRDATTPAIKGALRDAALDSAASDLLLVYFAGHGVVPQWSGDGDPYLAAADLELSVLRRAPEAGLRLGFLKRDVFEVCAGSSVLLLDCCHAGGYADRGVSAGTATVPTLDGAVDIMYRAQMSRHSALLACRRDAAARERQDLQHGVFTDTVLRGLSGLASGPNGEVSLESLAGYVADAGLDPEPGRFIQGWGSSIVLTRPRPDPRTEPRPVTMPASGRPALVERPTAGITVLPNPLDPVVEPLLGLLDRAFHHPPTGGATARAAHEGSGELARIQHATEADAVALLDLSPREAVDRQATASFRSGQLGETLSQIAQHAAAHGRDSLGFVGRTVDGLPVLAIPVAQPTESSVSTLVVVNPARPLLDLGEPLSRLLTSMWQQRGEADPLTAEMHALTALRREFGRLPLRLYRHSLERYRERLGRLIMVFEPVVSLNRNPGRMGVQGWEALARSDESHRSAPAALLQAAVDWGDEFVIERDSTLARRAIEGYAAAHARSEFRHDATHPLSINVGARSIMSDAYIDHLVDILDTTDLGYRRLILEISEKDPIGPTGDQVWLDDALEVFNRRLINLATRHHLAFAIDDFGVGHASLDRISKLTLTQIKIDRAVLSHPLGLQEIKLVVEVARHSPPGVASSPRDVVIEGFDSEAAIGLGSIYAAGVRLVQGYLTEEPATTELKPLGDVRARIAALLGAHA